MAGDVLKGGKATVAKINAAFGRVEGISATLGLTAVNPGAKITGAQLTAALKNYQTKPAPVAAKPTVKPTYVFNGPIGAQADEVAAAIDQKTRSTVIANGGYYGVM